MEDYVPDLSKPHIDRLKETNVQDAASLFMKDYSVNGI